jgi:hypothetical protein
MNERDDHEAEEKSGENAQAAAPSDTVQAAARKSAPSNIDETPYMSSKAAAAYERRAKITGVCILFAVLFAAALIFDLGKSAWKPEQRESIFAPTGNWKVPEMAQQTSPYPDAANPPQPIYDQLLLAHPRNAYDLPVREEDGSQAGLRVTAGEVKAIAPRSDKMSDGSVRKNLYARTEFYQPESRGVCYFHQYMGTVATYSVGDRVRVQYDTQAGDICGSSRIVK